MFCNLSCLTSILLCNPVLYDDEHYCMSAYSQHIQLLCISHFIELMLKLTTFPSNEQDVAL